MYKAFNLFFTDEVKQRIQTETNKRMSRKCKSFENMSKEEWNGFWSVVLLMMLGPRRTMK